MAMKRWLKWTIIATVAVVVLSVVYLAIEDAGVLRVGYADSPNPQHQQYKQALASWRGFEVAAQTLDSAYLLPHDLTVWFADCGQSNAFYQPEQYQVIICYELVSDLVTGYSRLTRSDSALTTAVWQTTFFVFYHEIGHAFIHVLDLPVTGREEDAVDQLATLILLNGGDAGRDAALQGASWFWLNARSRRRTPFWDQHSLDQQRYYNIICWVYGSNPTSHAALLSSAWGLPSDRAQSCSSEFDRMSRAWAGILSTHTY